MLLRKKIPCRNCTKVYKNYRSYKPYLAEDFNNSCGYCDDPDIYSDEYHIDHFAPKKFTELINKYDNLVYSCPYCNKAKWDKWPSDSPTIPVVNNEGFVDPCSEEYDKHLERWSDGSIRAKTDLGKYMFAHLKLHLRRHTVIPKLHEVRIELGRISDLQKTKVISNEEKEKLLQLQAAYIELNEELLQLTGTYN